MCDVSVILIDRSNWREFAALDIKENQYDLLPPRTGMYMLARHYAEPEWEIFAFALDDKLIGGFSLRMFEDEKRCGIERFFIAREYQEKGLASRALKASLDYLFKTYVDSELADITVEPENRHAVYIYKKCGFIENRSKSDPELMWLELKKKDFYENQ